MVGTTETVTDASPISGEPAGRVRTWLPHARAAGISSSAAITSMRFINGMENSILHRSESIVKNG